MKTKIKMGIDWSREPPAGSVIVNSMYVKDGKYYVWSGKDLLQYYDGSYTGVINPSLITPLKNMLAKLL